METSNQPNSQQIYRTLFWLLLAAFSVFRLTFANKFGLGVDESHYFLYSRHLAWGYFDHPPMVAFLAAITTSLGENVFFIRLGPIICSTLSLIVMRYLALALYRDERVALSAAILLILMPYQHLLMVALLPDAPLNLFWCGTLLMCWRATQTDRMVPWILAGLFFGGALLSKYHAVLLPLCLLGYLITSPDHRFWLAKLQPYVAVLVGLVVFAPNILWNANHDWISYGYQLGRGSTAELNMGKFLLAIGGQFGVWSPVIFGLLIAAFVVMIRQKKLNAADLFVIWTSLPVFAFFCITGLTSKILPHWTSVGWWSGAIAIATVMVKKIEQPGKSGLRWRRWSLTAAATGLVMSTVLYVALWWPIADPVYSWARQVSLKINQHIPAIKPIRPFDIGYDLSNELFGWDTIAQQVESIRAQMPNPANTFIFGHRFFRISQLGVYLFPDTIATSLHHKFDQYRLWFSAEDHKGWDALFIVDHKRHQERANRYAPLFNHMDPESIDIKVFRNNRLAQNYKIYKYFGFKGNYEK
jgi:undecaprenyl-diphosphatase